jgi:hypothetical protein
LNQHPSPEKNLFQRGKGRNTEQISIDCWISCGGSVMSESNTGMFPKSKNRKSSPKKEFIVENRKTGATGIADPVRPKTGAIRLETAAENSLPTGVTGEERHQLIAEAAYFRAEQRSFCPGYELADWLDAEAEIDTRLSTNSASSTSKDA